jgi:hypothetical protein
MRDWSGKLKKASKRGELTYCQARSEGLVGTAKTFSNRVGLWERMSTLSQSWLDHDGTLMSCRVKSEGLVKTAKEVSKEVRGTHLLSSADWGTGRDSILLSFERGLGQESKRKQASEGNSPPVEHEVRDRLGQQKNVCQ